ncbi:hypothetical protein [Sphingomonas sp.]|uniref:hypothetical protein n=1 Tax=Sphingomonas sp. TaxID=28214 RepID=UPI0025CE6CBE|nr:hypothetical protein [Sphingomonas sp.]MBV9528121.1 hypothetical protein [Sphingomonas sp.]
MGPDEDFGFFQSAERDQLASVENRLRRIEAVWIVREGTREALDHVAKNQRRRFVLRIFRNNRARIVARAQKPRARGVFDRALIGQFARDKSSIAVVIRLERAFG